ncbi:large subunit ribosomal protein L4 [Peptoniphilus asaccharolyticus DSM 20463]|uniref:Large ribosomal subunit protein uL4 n=1 Tax=Peptoniphilus asaccharolyticus DSM 20463 TaxID=573058 RepID=A0A1W1VKT9_PEPAS|nr:50S ribosomal protein L4 [Peptoniphilus asaccharolyticus]MBL7574479.1 50S ribosomal protein L4 [Peptoniphilus asaccharolyticus]SMB93938.1 large subunit ribosomal protein L4 [Peptoniphilus asaccharolyticus DSM 20463]
MPKVQVINMNGENISEVELNEEIFDIEVNEHAVYLVVKNILANRRQGTKSAKTRSEVRGGGRKPWRQKGTGRARQGSIRSPQFRGGGVVFAPKPRDFSYTTPKKVRRLALKSVLTSKLRDGEIIVLDNIKFDEVKTKNFQKMLNTIGADRKALVVTAENDKDVVRAGANIAGVQTSEARNINVYDLLKYNSLVITQDALKVVEEVFN